MGLLMAVLGGYGLYVLQRAGGFVVELYDRPLMAINFDRAASLDFAEMDKELVRRGTAAPPDQAAIDAKIEHLARTFGEDLAPVTQQIRDFTSTVRMVGEGRKLPSAESPARKRFGRGPFRSAQKHPKPRA